MISAYSLTPIFKPLSWPSAIPISHSLLCSIHHVQQWLSMYGSWTSIISISWELVKNADSPASYQISWTRNFPTLTRPRVRTSEPLMNVINQFTSWKKHCFISGFFSSDTLNGFPFRQDWLDLINICSAFPLLQVDSLFSDIFAIPCHSPLHGLHTYSDPLCLQQPNPSLTSESAQSLLFLNSFCSCALTLSNALI